jgi:hypothetical protein
MHSCGVYLQVGETAWLLPLQVDKCTLRVSAFPPPLLFFPLLFSSLSLSLALGLAAKWSPD